MSFFKYFTMGGVEFMSVLTILAAVVIGFGVKKAVDLFWIKEMPQPRLERGLKYIKFFGLMALVVGVFGQVIGLFQAFQAIEEIKEVSPSLLAGGLKVSSITTIYGFIIYIFSYLCWFVLNLKYERMVLTNNPDKYNPSKLNL